MKPIVNEIATRLRDEMSAALDDFEGLYVFGSQVRGDAKPHSDVDIVMLFGSTPFYMPDEFYEILSHMYADYYEAIDLDLQHYTMEQLKINPLFYNEVVNKGVYYGTV